MAESHHRALTDLGFVDVVTMGNGPEQVIESSENSLAVREAFHPPQNFEVRRHSYKSHVREVVLKGARGRVGFPVLSE